MNFDLNVFSSREGSILICEADLFPGDETAELCFVFASASPLQREGLSDEIMQQQ